jgi:hypothetical protein
LSIAERIGQPRRPPQLPVFLSQCAHPVASHSSSQRLMPASRAMPPPFTFLFQQSALSHALFALLLFFLALVDACRPSSGAAVNYLFTDLRGSNWKTVTGWSTPLTKATAKTEFFGLKQSSCVVHPPCSCYEGP